MLRFISHTRNRSATFPTHPSAEEQVQDEKRLFKLSQELFYHSECRVLQRLQSLLNTNPLSAYSPFLDPDGLLRIGGRLQQSQLDFNCSPDCYSCKVTFSFITGQAYTSVSSCWSIHSDVYDDSIVLYSQAAESCKES